ncbi:carbohydrate-binding protein [Pelagicoccus enzymogenes]|uniref:alpha-amylase family glycosyl hydrolase n=1 Tax=Pelagicoccus enzymogenes TaxID=2773457 RepID=UPI00280DD42D|nr:alpha-amylase family glycosyl hydrolase [Pelagicoccus enzymogenes]MDQ8197658.1 carbohydrate-binding protein [Pelagicoccus enzymogenes]
MKITHLLLAMTLGRAVAASSVSVVPEFPVSGEDVTIIYDPEGGVLSDASKVYLYRGFNDWAAVAGPDQEMSWNEDLKAFEFTYQVPEAAYKIDFVFRDGDNVWDNNGTLDWHVEVTLADAPAELPKPPPLPDTASESRVMMQGFYWDAPAGNWYKIMASKASELRNMGSGQGIDRIWFPPPSKSESGPYSMGYDPYDYYDLGQYNQKGTVRTRFGTQEELKAALSAFREEGILCMADIVLNHRSGGDWQVNPNTGDAYWTDFSGVASGKAKWDYDDFHPSSLEVSDEGKFAGFPDVAHKASEGPGDPVYDLLEWGNWLTDPANAGFDGGWRYDYVKGFSPRMIRDFREGTGSPFGIIECWDGIPMIEAYLRVCGGTSAFDFPNYYAMRDIFNDQAGGGNIASLRDSNRSLLVRNPEYAVTFVANHDTDEIASNRMLAYAYILTSEGYPCLFWRDYFDRGLADLGGQAGNGIKALVWARGALAGGKPEIEILQGNHADLLVYGTKNGLSRSPGYIVAINDSASLAESSEVYTSNPLLRGRRLKCYAWYSYVAGKNVQPSEIEVSLGGRVAVSAPPRGYAVYGPVDLAVPEVKADSFDRQAGKARLTVRNVIEGVPYRIESRLSLGREAGWSEAGAFLGTDSGELEVTVDWIPQENVFWRVVAEQ